MIDTQRVQEVLNTIRPMLQEDGGDVRLISVWDDGTVEVELEGACKGCPMAQQTLANGVEQVLRDALPFVTRVVAAE